MEIRSLAKGSPGREEEEDGSWVLASNLNQLTANQIVIEFLLCVRASVGTKPYTLLL